MPILLPVKLSSMPSARRATELPVDLALHQLLVSLRDDVGGVVEKQDRPVEALDGLLLLHGRDEKGLELRVEPDVAPHQRERVDRLLQGDPVFVTIVGVLRVHALGFVKGVLGAENPPEFRVELNGLWNGPVCGKIVIGRGFGIFPDVCVPLTGDLVRIVLRDIDQFRRYGLHGVPPCISSVSSSLMSPVSLVVLIGQPDLRQRLSLDSTVKKSAERINRNRSIG